MSILKNEKYKGDAILQKSFTKDFLTHQRELINGFMHTLQNTGAVAEEFDAGMWCGLVAHVTVTDKENIVFTFKNGLETKIS